MRRRIRMTILVALPGLLLACGSSTTPNTARISGTVTAGSLGPQSGVGVTLGRATPPEPMLHATTGTNGGFEFTGLAPGDWVVTLDAPTLAAGCLEPAARPVYVSEGGQADASFALTYVQVPGVYAGTATAVTAGSITDSLAARGAVFFPSGPFDMQVMMTGGNDPHRFTITFDGGGRSLAGTCLVVGSRVDSLQLNGSNEVPGVAGLEYSSQPPDVYPPPVAAPPDSVRLASASGQARLAGRMTTYWHLVAIYGDLRQNVVLYFDVTRTGR